MGTSKWSNVVQLTHKWINRNLGFQYGRNAGQNRRQNGQLEKFTKPAPPGKDVFGLLHFRRLEIELLILK